MDIALPIGRRFVVDADPAKFFDRVKHDMLVGRLARWIADRVSKLIRRYREAGVLADGVVIERHEGMPKGRPPTVAAPDQQFPGPSEQNAGATQALFRARS
ncbi:hypothetical protein RA307_22395 [Xanthobacteraceae bacterium Astr-EGSB]|uniref:hypothetical protein n=1 Tax=Astrobacterium formosum TaxID=3069710 RepID=UPI0027B2F988|nr:hypothetical protein [Xanthobacteraceae bacterium Astr-EGSB]